jgi:hypothetical protein
MRAALMAGKSPAAAPMITAAARPPAHASGGTTTGQSLAWACMAVASAPGPTPGGTAQQGEEDGFGQLPELLRSSL